MARDETRRRRRTLLRSAQAYIRAQYPDPDLDLRQVAAATGASPRQLQRVFREQAGEDFRGYLLRIRMEAAFRLLTRKRNPLPIYRAARRVGYRQHSGLRQAFLRYYGYNPSEIQEPPPSYVGTEVEPASRLGQRVRR
jgi:two-component system, response regulator YesN